MHTAQAPLSALHLGDHPLQTAVRKRDIDLISIVVNPQNVNEKDGSQQTALHVACSKVIDYICMCISYGRTNSDINI